MQPGGLLLRDDPRHGDAKSPRGSSSNPLNTQLQRFYRFKNDYIGFANCHSDGLAYQRSQNVPRGTSISIGAEAEQSREWAWSPYVTNKLREPIDQSESSI